MVSISSAVPSLKSTRLPSRLAISGFTVSLPCATRRGISSRHGRVRLIDGVVGIGHAIARRRPLQQPQAALEQPALHQPRQRDHLDGGENVAGREAHDELGHEPVAAADAQEHLASGRARRPTRCRPRSCRSPPPARACRAPAWGSCSGANAASRRRTCPDRSACAAHRDGRSPPPRRDRGAARPRRRPHLPQLVAARRDLRHDLAEFDMRRQPELARRSRGSIPARARGSDTRDSPRPASAGRRSRSS